MTRAQTASTRRASRFDRLPGSGRAALQKTATTCSEKTGVFSLSPETNTTACETVTVTRKTNAVHQKSAFLSLVEPKVLVYIEFLKSAHIRIRYHSRCWVSLQIREVRQVSEDARRVGSPGLRAAQAGGAGGGCEPHPGHGVGGVPRRVAPRAAARLRRAPRPRALPEPARPRLRRRGALLQTERQEPGFKMNVAS